MTCLRSVLVLALTAAVAAIGGAFPAAASASIAGDSYVAMGDSYAAGEGIGTTTGAPVPGCLQSADDYPHLVAAVLGLRLVDVSCSGAVTGNIDTEPQQTGSGTAPLQDAALTSSTDLVTITIGGNDLGFVSIAEYCAATSPAGPLALHPQRNCMQVYDPNGDDSLQHKLETTVTPAIERVLADVKRKAPKAKILVLDYPAISTDKADAPDPATYPSSCFSSPLQKNSFPFTAVDTPYLDQLQAHLGDAVRAAAVASGAAFIDVFPQSLTHSACAGTSVPWMNGITVDATQLSVVTGSLHPNLAGATAMAQSVAVAAEKALTTVKAPSAARPAVSKIASKRSGLTGTLIIVVVGAALVVTIASASWLRRRARAGRPS